MKKAIACIILTCILQVSDDCFAQKWKQYRYEFIFGAGATNFLGELGGADKIGAHTFRDFEFKATRPAATVGIRMKLNEYMSVKTNLTYGRLYGNDKFTNEYFRNFRNLNFFSNLYEFSGTFEGSLLKEVIGRKYRLRGVKGKRGYEVTLYGFGGFSLFRFNPKTRDVTGKIVALQPLHTEGQGLLPSRQPYHRVVLAIPFGLGFKYALSKRWSLALDYGIRYTFTDYLDDVSTTFVNPTLLASQPNGVIASRLANRSDATGVNNVITAPGQQRGNPRYNDSYMFALVTLNYKLRTVKGSMPRF